MKFTNKEIRANIKAWLKALRSGKYKQTTVALKNSQGFCCLGVACDVLIKKGVVKRFPINGTELGATTQAALGMERRNGSFRDEGGGTLSLVYLNDERKNTFNEIADTIESAPEGLFNPGIFKPKKTKAPNVAKVQIEI